MCRAWGWFALQGSQKHEHCYELRVQRCLTMSMQVAVGVNCVQVVAAICTYCEQFRAKRSPLSVNFRKFCSFCGLTRVTWCLWSEDLDTDSPELAVFAGRDRE